MKKIMLVTLLILSVVSYGQVRQMSYDTIEKYTKNRLKFKGLSIVYDEYLSKDGFLYKVGDDIKISKPVSGDKFSFITDRWTQSQATSTMIGKDMIIKNIMLIGTRNSGYELCMTIKSKMAEELILKFESAIKFEEIKPKGMSSDDALSELKKTKDKLDLGLISKEEFETKKIELAKYIK